MLNNKRNREIMNQKIYSTLEEIKIHTHKNPIATSDRQTNLSIKNSELQVLLAEESEKNAKKLGKLTNVLIGLTVVIAILTAVLVFFEFRTENKKIDQNRNFKTEQNQQNK
jgi:hypothetical protein